MGLNNIVKRRNILRYMLTLKTIGLQETHLLMEDAVYFNKIFMEHFFSSVKITQKGVMIVIQLYAQW